MPCPLLLALGSLPGGHGLRQGVWQFLGRNPSRQYVRNKNGTIRFCAARLDQAELGQWLGTSSLGAQAVSHLPCRFDCEKTVVVGKQLLKSGEKRGTAGKMDNRVPLPVAHL